MKNLKKQNGLRLPSHFLKDTGLDQERSLLAALFPGVILLTRRYPSPQDVYKRQVYRCDQAFR